jgi:hypothetical protein
MKLSSLRSKQAVLLVLGAIVVILLSAVPAKAQCALTAWMGGGYCYDWGNMFSGQTVRIFSSGGKGVQARTPFGVFYGEWVSPGDAVLDAGGQVICCYGQRSTGMQFGICKVCG